MRSHRFLPALASCVLLAQTAAAQSTDVTRWILSHGRLDKVRAAGIATDVHTGPPELVSVVPGITPTQLERKPGDPQTIPPGTAPGALPFTILDWIDNQPDKNRISITPPDAPNPEQIINSGANIPSCFSLVIANTPGGFQWQIPRPRFGSGNVYATVSFYDAAGNAIIKRGQELVTPEHFKAYTANSVLYEGPDVGFPIQDNQLDGGTTHVGFKVEPGKPPITRLVGYADPLEVEIIIAEQLQLRSGALRVKLIGRLDNNFEPIGATYFRWAFDTNVETKFIEVAADNTLLVDFIPPPTPGEPPAAGEPNEPYYNPWIPKIVADPGLVKVTLVASAYAPFVPATAPTVPPFVRKIGELGDRMGLDSFSSVACTLSDTETIQVKYDKRKRRKHSITHSICFLLDASGSMSDNDRMVHAKASIAKILQMLPKRTEVALIAYYNCGDIRVEHEFTTDPSKIIAILPGIQPSGSTPLAAGIAFAKDYVRKHASGKNRSIKLLSDGKETCGGDPIAEAGN